MQHFHYTLNVSSVVFVMVNVKRTETHKKHDKQMCKNENNYTTFSKTLII